MKRLPYRSWLETLGWPGLLAVGALLLAAVLSGVLTPRWSAQAEQQLALVRQAWAQRPLRVLPQAPAAPRWPASSAGPERSADLLALALHHGVTLQRTREQMAEGGHLQLNTSASGGYAELRAYLAAALAADPALVLDSLRLQRASASSGDLQAELQWTLLQRPVAAAARVLPGARP